MGVEIVGFLIFAISQVGTPGPANLALLATGANYGLKSALHFVLGVVLGKQLIIWPIGFGITSLVETMPNLFHSLKWISVFYIVWLAYRILHSKLVVNSSLKNPPNFLYGLILHPLNPKAWAMVIAGFTSFVEPGTPVIIATSVMAIIFFFCQLILHPLWCWGGEKIANSISGGPKEKIFFLVLSAMTIFSILFIFK